MFHVLSSNGNVTLVQSNVLKHVCTVTVVVSLTIVLNMVNRSICSLELREGAFCGHKLLVGAHLSDLPLHHDQDQVSLGKAAQPMGHQHTRLHSHIEMFVANISYSKKLKHSINHIFV